MLSLHYSVSQLTFSFHVSDDSFRWTNVRGVTVGDRMIVGLSDALTFLLIGHQRAYCFPRRLFRH